MPSRTANTPNSKLAALPRSPAGLARILILLFIPLFILIETLFQTASPT